MNPIESLKVRLKYFLYLSHLDTTNKRAYEYEIKKKKTPPTFFERMEAEEVKRPYYAYGMYHAALNAKAIGIEEIAVIEFGVAGGKGVVVMEAHAQEIEAETGVKFRIFGFDSGEGMPPPNDYRDLPYIWEEGFFGMDEDKLRASLKATDLRLGPVETTVKQFMNEEGIPPIGFIAFDLDFYSSTVSAFALLELPAEKFLPRTFCYFDDCIGDDWEIHSEFTGELLAIKEFNNTHDKRKIAKIENLRHKRIWPAFWNDEMFAFQIFDHPEFATRKGKAKKWELELAQG